LEEGARKQMDRWITSIGITLYLVISLADQTVDRIFREQFTRTELARTS